MREGRLSSPGPPTGATLWLAGCRGDVQKKYGLLCQPIDSETVFQVYDNYVHYATVAEESNPGTDCPEMMAALEANASHLTFGSGREELNP
jgi:hypothetical protein